MNLVCAFGNLASNVDEGLDVYCQAYYLHSESLEPLSRASTVLREI